MSTFTVIDGERAVEVEARIEGERVLLDPSAVKDALGWEYHDGQLCSDMMCIPIDDAAGLLRDGAIELGGLARALDRPLALDVAERAACLGASARERCPISTGRRTRSRRIAARRSCSSPGPRGEGAGSTCRSGRR
jgi:hypothetical protein